MTILVTGANRGIGAALRDAYLARGADVIGTRRGDGGDGWLPLDVTDPEAVAALGPAMGDRPLDLLVCNAGVLLDRDEALGTGYAAPLWARTFAVNVTGVFLTIQAVLANLRAARGRVTILSSQLASTEEASGGRLIYRASKAAVLNLGRNLASDLAEDGIAVGIYHPGWVSTDMGGPAAAISPREAASGLVARFDALDMATTGCFETWDGRPHPF